ncbi:hypothetical protein CRENBAI_013596 [Crenichthys baileyi]|uniref:Uncharacterized protein n=1 Tax=Crenichthys baileyi TaxID=28760 RepID=A0AAV9RFN8_9TELE
MAPLPSEAEEFKNMPKGQCNICKVVFPLQILAFHVKDCVELLSSSDEIETGQSHPQIPTPQHINSEEPVDEELPCPICLIQFAPEALEAHASFCGERGEED